MCDIEPEDSLSPLEDLKDTWRSEPVLFCDSAGRARKLGIAAWATFTLIAILSHLDAAGGLVLLVLHGIALAGAVWGLISGIVALLRIKNSNGRLWGRASAIGGICLSGIYIATLITLALIIPPAQARARAYARKLRCSYKLEYIADAANAWRDQLAAPLWYPPSLKTLRDDGVLQSRWDFFCPSRGDERAQTEEFATDYEAIFDRAGFEIRTWMVSGRLPLAWDKKGNHPDGFHVVRFSGVAEFIKDDPQGTKRQQILDEVDAWIAKNRPKEPQTD